MPSKILVVDDSKLMHGMYEMSLKRYGGLKLLHAYDGQQALDLLAKNSDCQLVILDINMPVMNGIEFLQQFRGSAARTPIPVIIVSTEGKEEQRKRGLEAGAAAYLAKPLQPKDLHMLIDRLLGVEAGGFQS